MASLRNTSGFDLQSSSREVNIQISSADLEALKKGEYYLCFAKNLNDEYNVVWQCYSDYLTSNYFSWDLKFQLFGTNTFIPENTIKTITNIQDCDLGMVCLLDEIGLLEVQRSGGTTNKLTINNEYGFIHSGVNQFSTGIDGTVASSPIYVARTKELRGDIQLAPKAIVRIWFQQNIQTSMMISGKPSNSIDLDLTLNQTIACVYEDQKWSII